MIHFRWLVGFFVNVVCFSASCACATDCIYSVNKDGTDLRVEVDRRRMDQKLKFSAPHHSADGRRLIFDATPFKEQDFDFTMTKLYVLDTAGSSKGDLVDLDYGKSGRWSPDGKSIAFSVYDQNPKGFQPGIWVMTAAGTDAKWIADGRWPQWTPDGKSVITKNYGANGIFLLKVDVATLKTEPFVENHRPHWQIHWSPDGKRLLAYLINDDGTRHLVTMNAGGEKDSIVELADGDLMNLGYSPDGACVCYTKRNMTRGNDIFVAPADSSEGTKKLDVLPNIMKEHFCWMSDSQRIIFCAQNDLVD